MLWTGLVVLLGVTVYYLLSGAACAGTASGGTTAELEASAGTGESSEARPSRAVERLTVRVLEEYPHDPNAYTQGLLWDEGWLLESTGKYGRSVLRRWRPGDSESRETALEGGFFGEGLARAGDRLIQLTWREGRALIYERRSLDRLGEWKYRGEGWGLCFDGARLVMSDGSSVLTFRDPATFAILERKEVRLEDRRVDNLNELECAEGWIFANVYPTDEIVRVDPRNGEVTAVVNASGLLNPQERTSAEMLNGIAYDPDTETFLLTGKLWPKIFRVVLERE